MVLRDQLKIFISTLVKGDAAQTLGIKYGTVYFVSVTFIIITFL